ncbi:MAG: DUF4386 family protein [candidate division WOR-3 bacterium]|nr:MAG: DUF4386 family protein [candidate division WOR-3 bacterium]
MFRSGVVGYALILVLDVLVAWALYVVLTPVNRHVAMIAARFRLM